MTEIRKWLIKKLGGSIAEKNTEHPFCVFKSSIYTHEHVTAGMYVPAAYYTDSTKKNIEQELASLIGKELLDRDLLAFCDSGKADRHGDVYVHCQINVLKHKDRAGIMPSRLKEVKNSINKKEPTR